MFSFKSSCVVGILFAATPVLASAAVISVDDFATPLGDHALSTTGSIEGAQAAPGALGGRRELTLTRNTGVSAAFDKLTVTQFSDGTSPFLDFDQTSGAQGTLKLVYDGLNGDLNVDLSLNRKVTIDFALFNPGEGSAMEVTVQLFDGVSTAVSSAFTTGLGGQAVVVDFTSPDFASTDFSSIDSITLIFDAPMASDFRVASITAPEAQMVPEPAGLLLMAAGGVLVFARRRHSN